MTGDDEALTLETGHPKLVEVFEPSVSARALVGLIEGLRHGGVDARAFLREFGIESALDPDSVERYAMSQLLGLWPKAAAVANDPLFGVHAARVVEAHSFGLFSFLAMTSETWGHALERVCRFFRLLTDWGRYELSVTSERALLGFVPAQKATQVSCELCDFVVAVPFQYGMVNVDDFRISEVLLPYPEPAHAAALIRFFDAPVRFSAQALGIVFSTQLLTSPLRRADSKLAALLESVAEEQVSRLPDVGESQAQLRTALRQALRAGQATLPKVASKLGVSPRALQRRLRAQNTSFAAELNEVRRELALVLVAQPSLSLQEAAFLLGFSEPAAFHRAFRRWTGQSPGRYRQRLST